MRIAIVEDDPDQQDLIAASLKNMCDELDQFVSSRQLFRAMQASSYDLIVLDWYLPEVDGLDILATLRNDHRWPGAVLFITADDTEENVVRALRAGADDFLNKPLRIPELQARVEALTRRLGLDSPRPSPTINCGMLQLDKEKRRILVNQVAVTLSDREFRLAAIFLEHPGQLFTRTYLLERIWGISGDVSTRTVDTHISRLRRKLELEGQHGYRLKSIYQQGYRLESDV